MPDYAQRVTAFNKKIASLSQNSYSFPYNPPYDYPYIVSTSLRKELPTTPNYEKLKASMSSVFRPNSFKEIKKQFNEIENRNSPANYHFVVSMGQDLGTYSYDFYDKALKPLGHRYALPFRESWPLDREFNQDLELKKEAIARREREASELIQSQAYKNLEKQLQKLMNPPKFRPRTYMTDKLSVKSDPRLLVNTVNNLKKALQRRNTSEAPIGRGTSDFFANILRVGDRT